jgi:hypothetical protein
MKDPSNTSRLGYLSSLVEWSSTDKGSSLQFEITEFVATTRRLFFMNIQPPTVAEVDDLVNEGRNVSQVLGLQPSGAATISTLDVSLAHYTCACQECDLVKDFLRGDASSITLPLIGALKRKHVEQELSTSYLRELVTYNMISTVPQGLEVRVLKSFRSFTN